MRLPAAAIVLALAMPCRAQVPDDVVTLYGRIHVLGEAIGARDSAGLDVRLNRVTNQASMAGLRGAHALGDGWRAWFQVETGFPPDNESSAFATRNSAAGIDTPWGTLLMGRWDSAFEQSQVGVIDPFNDQGLPDVTGAAVHQGNFARRQQNAAQYWSPQWRGLRVKLAYAANEARRAGLDPYDYGASLTYADASSYAAVAYERHHDQAGAAAIAGIDEAGVGVAGFHRLGPVKLMAQAGRYSRTGTVAQRSFLAGFEWTLARIGVGEPAILATLQRSRDGGSIGTPQPACTLWGAGYRLALSRRTFLIAEFAHVKNTRGNLCNFGSNAYAVGEAGVLRGFGLGMRTLF